MFICQSDGLGNEYLVINPSTVCWEGTHMWDVGLASLGVCVYLLLIPFGYFWALLR